MGVLSVSVEDLLGYSKLQDTLRMIVDHLNNQEVAMEALQASKVDQHAVDEAIKGYESNLIRLESRVDTKLAAGLQHGGPDGELQSAVRALDAKIRVLMFSLETLKEERERENALPRIEALEASVKDLEALVIQEELPKKLSALTKDVQVLHTDLKETERALQGDLNLLQETVRQQQTHNLAQAMREVKDTVEKHGITLETVRVDHLTADRNIQSMLRQLQDHDSKLMYCQADLAEFKRRLEVLRTLEGQRSELEELKSSMTAKFSISDSKHRELSEKVDNEKIRFDGNRKTLELRVAKLEGKSTAASVALAPDLPQAAVTAEVFEELRRQARVIEELSRQQAQDKTELERDASAMKEKQNQTEHRSEELRASLQDLQQTCKVLERVLASRSEDHGAGDSELQAHRRDLLRLVDALRHDLCRRLDATDASVDKLLRSTESFEQIEQLMSRFKRMQEQITHFDLFMQTMIDQASSTTTKCVSCGGGRFQNEEKTVIGSDGRQYRRRSTPAQSVQAPETEVYMPSTSPEDSFLISENLGAASKSGRPLSAGSTRPSSAGPSRPLSAGSQRPPAAGPGNQRKRPMSASSALRAFVDSLPAGK